MAICSLCKSITWENLPELPAHVFRTRPDEKYIFPFTDQNAGTPLYRSFPHQQGLAALQKSAVTCQLCDLILQSITNVVGEWAQMANTASRLEPNFHLFLTKPPNRDHGMWVYSASENPMYFYMVAPIGLCVGEGTYNP